MNALHVGKWCLVAALAGLGANFGLHKAIAAQPIPADAEEGVQVLTRGPVHEAFAETVTFDPQPGVVAPKAPPEAIEELPPDQRPEGDNVAWIPGYWGWDDERSDFLWISGVWRALPPGRQWVPGYWGKTEQGFQWTSGYWADAQVTEVQYLSEPPATVEAGPNIAASSADQSWLPGCWVWRQNRYAWRPGFWATVQPDWVWIPAHYVYAPRGYVFVEGYWDYSIGRRGVLFAPVYFGAGVYGRRGFSYSPTMVIDLGVFSQHLFVRPRYQHYYFGDYYAANYHTAGFYPSHSYHTGRHGYDPIYAHDRWRHRQDPQWERSLAADFQNRREHVDARPPRTWAAQEALGATALSSRERNLAVAMPLGKLAGSKGSPMRFQPVNKLERQSFGQHGHELQKLRDERHNLRITTAAASAEKPSREFAPARVKFPGSPIVAKPVAALGKDHAPPKLYEAPKLDTTVKPKVDLPTLKPQPKSKVDLPTLKPQPKSKVELPTLKPQPKAKVELPTLKPQPKAKVDLPTLKPQPKPKVELPTLKPQPKAKVDLPTLKPQPKAKVELPTPKPQPKVDRPAPPIKVDRPAPPPKVDRPAPPIKVDRPAPPIKVDRPAPPPKVDRPGPPPKADRPTGPAPKDDKHKGKD